jgi:DMSO/TMAO reductase YedYZ molybdopterin-dependent catalytic subunit
VLRAGASFAALCAADSREAIAHWLQASCASSGARGELLGVVPFLGDRSAQTPLAELVGGPGLDARLFTDLAALEPDRLITPTSSVFVRTVAPSALRTPPASWTIPITGGPRPAALSLDDLLAQARPMGTHLIECSGNSDPQNFGLMSVVEWDGVPLSDVLGPVRRSGARTFGVLVRGADDEEQQSRTSVPGASWVLPFEIATPFLAVRMNGQPLSPDHGAPVRLVVPGWYGCSWIKWVNELRLVADDEPATSQMREFATRTHQAGVPALARDYAPPSIDLAATAVRVEKRRVDGRIAYRIVGIVWGGDRPVDRLLIRFGPTDAPKPVSLCPPPKTHLTWSLWDYWWQPEAPGIYAIGLRAGDPSIRTRRLDISFYVRRVRIDDA